MSERYPASRETDAMVARVLGYREVGSDYRGWWGTPPDLPLANLPDSIGSTLIPNYTTDAPDDWSVVGEMVAAAHRMGVDIGIEAYPSGCRACGQGDFDDEICSDLCASPGHAVAQVLLQVAEREKTDE